LFRLVTLIPVSTTPLAGISCRSVVGHDSRKVEPLRVSFSTSSLTLRSSLRY
jgi:hypothetical protein